MVPETDEEEILHFVQDDNWGNALGKMVLETADEIPRLSFGPQGCRPFSTETEPQALFPGVPNLGMTFGRLWKGSGVED